MLALVVGVVGAMASPGKGTMPPPTGQRMHGQSLMEAVFNGEVRGQIGYVDTPKGTQQPVPANPKSWAPIYVVEYPTSSTITTDGTGAEGPLSCWHTPSENCLTHGNALAGLAQSTEPDVYGGGVLGHDHVMDFHGADDWNVAWEPILVLFTNSSAANTRLLTEQEIADAYAAGDVTEISLPGATFHCSPVSARVWALSSPYTGPDRSTTLCSRRRKTRRAKTGLPLFSRRTRSGRLPPVRNPIASRPSCSNSTLTSREIQPVCARAGTDAETSPGQVFGTGP